LSFFQSTTVTKGKSSFTEGSSTLISEIISFS
jgi:hypothetical protein